MDQSAEPTLGEVIRRLVRIEDRLDRSFVGAQVYEAEKSAAIEARQALESRLEARGQAREHRIASLENTVNWLLRSVVAAIITGVATIAFSYLT